LADIRHSDNHHRVSARLTLMLNTPLSDVDHVARPVVAIGTD